MTQLFTVLLVAAGQGSRMGADMPKQYMPLAGRTLLRHTIDNILAWPGLESLYVVIAEGHEDYYQDSIAGIEHSALKAPLYGGAERHESVMLGLEALGCDDNVPVLIHDAARPFVEWSDVAQLLPVLKEGVGASLVSAVRDTLVNKERQDSINRSDVVAVHTPQAFLYGDILKAHKSLDVREGVTDDAGVARAASVEVVLVEGTASNFKITTQDDFVMAEKLIKADIVTRTGMGFDVHAFDVSNSDKDLILCGIVVDHDAPLKGHSDADVGLHTITDALLGAIGQGDIGQHFPPSDDAYKDMDSALFLEKAVALMQEAGGSLINIDVTLICERPKIGPYALAMRARIAEICGIKEAQVNVKATTTEKLGFTGRGEGIAAQAVVNVQMPV